MAQVRLLGALGYGIFTLLVVNNVDGAGDYLSELARTTVHFLSRGKDRLTNAATAAGGPDLSLLSDKLDRLSAANRDPLIIHSSSYAPNSAASWITTVVGGTALTLAAVHFSGLFDLSGWAYVTQAKFKLATDQLERGVKLVGDALAKTKTELLAKLGVVEKNLDLARRELKGEIQSSAADIRKDVKVVSGEIRHLHADVSQLDTKLDGLQDGMGELRSAIEHANRGIALLCHVVAESFFHNSNNGNSRGSSAQQALKDLQQYNTSGKSAAAITAGGTSPADVLKQLAMHSSAEGPIMRLMSAVKADKRELLAAARHDAPQPQPAAALWEEAPLSSS